MKVTPFVRRLLDDIIEEKENGHDVSYVNNTVRIYLLIEEEWKEFYELSKTMTGDRMFKLADRKVYYEAIRNYFYVSLQFIMNNYSKDTLSTVNSLNGFRVSNNTLEFLIDKSTNLPTQTTDMVIKKTPVLHTIYSEWMSLGAGDFNNVGGALVSLERFS